jgi:hypothetical protein
LNQIAGKLTQELGQTSGTTLPITSSTEIKHLSASKKAKDKEFRKLVIISDGISLEPYAAHVLLMEMNF